MTVSEQIVSVIDALCEKFGVAVDWTSANVIPYVEQLAQKYIKYEIVTSSVTIAVLLLLFVTDLIITIKMYKKAEWDQYTWHMEEAIAIGGTIVAIVLAIVSCTVIPMECKDIIACITFPEKQIFEYAQSLLSK